ncbi:MAG: hypothetical protein IT530_20180 [Burkholderiales bacterium]|nr:hypothetical protein [Burkholderiales bacterium]
MSWTTPRELKAQLARLWDRGELLRAAVGGGTCFPLRLELKRPASAELTDRFEAVRVWATEIAQLAHARVEWREVRHRVHGMQRLPVQVWVDSVEAALTWLGKRHEAERFVGLVDATRRDMPSLVPWLLRRPLLALDLAEAWPRLTAVVRWMIAHPRPTVYLRQVDVPGVHSKFIEQQRGVLAELLDLALPADAVDATHAGVARFASRYGFLDKPVRIRFRVLDARIAVVPGTTMADVTLDAASFARMAVPVRKVFITENETNFLALPSVAESLAIFGAGYGWDALARAQWLHGCELHYWGDIDTHGYAILDALRAHFPHAASLLMDRETLLAHRAHWTDEPDPVRHDLSRLNDAERALYDDLRHDRIAPRLRLEQERIGFEWVRRCLRE